MLFQDNQLDLSGLNDERTEDVLTAATNRTIGRLRPSDVLAAAIENGDDKILATLSKALETGSTPQDMIAIIDVYNPPNDDKATGMFDGKRESFTAEVLKALEQFDAALQNIQEKRGEIALELLLSCILGNPDEEDRDYLAILNWDKAAELFEQHVDFVSQSLTPLFDENTAQLRRDEFTEDGWSVLESAAVHARALGYENILPPHCLLALLGETEGVAEQLLRLQLSPEVGLRKVSELITQTFRLGDRKEDPLALNRAGISEAAIELLAAAQKSSRLWGVDKISDLHIFQALLEYIPTRLAQVLQRAPLNLNLEKLQNHLVQHLREESTNTKKDIAFQLPESLLPSEDLTWLARSSKLSEAIRTDQYFDPIARALYRRNNNHVLLTGMRGVGKTTVVRELARRAAAGEIDFLKRKRFLRVDCQDVAPAESTAKLEGIFAHIAGRNDLVVILDGVGALLRTETGGDNKARLKSVLKDGQIQIIAIMLNWDYEELLSADEQFLEAFSRVTIEEPGEDAAIEMVNIAASELAKEYKTSFEARAVERAVRLSANFIMNERLPVKAIKILRRACQDIDYMRNQAGKLTKEVSGQNKERVSRDDIIRIISEISGVPIGTISGTGEKVDFQEVLGEAVIGQDAAVKAVAQELQLIKAGLSDPGKPASVMLFAGLTGVGKSELAKTIAKFYSASKSLHTYTMGNFSESHSVSGIIGVPPGYQGHDQGGRLINDINSDPYSVFLLDEAEKANPEVWKPFLNLFDEGWIVDQRGVKAFADRSIFILTSNAGQSIISSMMGSTDASMDRIIEKVKTKLSELKHERTQQLIFTPEFLARIKRIIIFKPLDEPAMQGICRILIRQMQKTWKDKREKTVIVPESLIKHIARESHQENEKSGGKEGGRIVRKKISELIEASIQEEASKDEKAYQSCNQIELLFISEIDNKVPGMSIKPTISINFSVVPPPTPKQSINQAVESLLELQRQPEQNNVTVLGALSEQILKLEEMIKALENKGLPDGAGTDYQGIMQRFRETEASLMTIANDTKNKTLALLEQLIREVVADTGGKVDE